MQHATIDFVQLREMCHPKFLVTILKARLDYCILTWDFVFNFAHFLHTLTVSQTYPTPVNASGIFIGEITPTFINFPNIETFWNQIITFQPLEIIHFTTRKIHQSRAPLDNGLFLISFQI